MSDDEIKKLATTFGLYPNAFVMDFARALIAAEQEACATVCDSKVAAEYSTGKVDHNEIGWTQACAAAIRARGEK